MMDPAWMPAAPTLAAFALAAVLLILTPGPDMTLFLTRTLLSGRSAGFASLAGVLAGLVVHTALAAIGLSALLLASAEAFLAAKVAGAAYLLWLAWKAVRYGARLDLATGPTCPDDRQPLAHIFANGLLVNVLNPKVALFFLTFLPQFVDAHDAHATAKLVVLGAVYVLLSLPLCGLAIVAVDRIAGLVRSQPGILRVVDALTAALFTAFALRLLLSARPVAP